VRNRIAVAAYARRNPEKIAARRALAAAVKRGEVIRATACEAAGCDRTEPLHAHHGSYAKARVRDVVFLCRQHHEAVHHRGPLPLKGGKLAHPPKRPPASSRQRSERSRPPLEIMIHVDSLGRWRRVGIRHKGGFAAARQVDSN
jgi:hypothetical protein